MYPYIFELILSKQEHGHLSSFFFFVLTFTCNLFSFVGTPPTYLDPYDWTGCSRGITGHFPTYLRSRTLSSSREVGELEGRTGGRDESRIRRVGKCPEERRTIIGRCKVGPYWIERSQQLESVMDWNSNGSSHGQRARLSC